MPGSRNDPNPAPLVPRGWNHPCRVRSRRAAGGGQRRAEGGRTVRPPRCDVGMRSFDQLATAAERHHGLLSVDDLRRFGVGKQEVARWVSVGRMAPLARGVYRVRGAPPTTDGRILAGVLVHGEKTWAAHRTAAWLWDLPGFGPPGRVEVIRAAGLSNERLPAWVHRTTCMLEHHHTTVRAIPVTTMARTIFDLGGRMGIGSLDRMVEAGLRTAACSMGALHRVLGDLGGRGRPGTVAMRAVLAERGAGYVPTESELDVLGRAAVRAVRGIEWQVEMSDERGYIRRVDGLHRAAGLVIEWDGAQFHDSRSQLELDRVADARLAALGLEVHRFRWYQVTEDPASVYRLLTSRILQRRAAA